MSSHSTSQKPLLNRMVLIACSEKKMSALAAGLDGLGATVLSVPVIKLCEMEDKQLLDRAIEEISQYSWIIFTSVYGVHFFLQRLNELRTVDPLLFPKVCAIGPATAKAVRDCKFEVALTPERFVAEGIVEALERDLGTLTSLAGQRILLPRAMEAREILPDALAAAGAIVDVVPCYRNVRGSIDEHTLRRLRTTQPDLIVFTSSSTARNLIDILGSEDGKNILQKSKVAVLGPITRDTVASFGKSAEIVPKENTVASLLEAVGSYFSKHFQ
jgi:uroporphyrinogen III methyltransferase/synthase